LLASLHRLGLARVSQLQRDSGLPRTTVYRLLTQLEEVGAVERSAGRWRIGPTLVEYGAGVPAAPRLRSVARRPLMDLANATGALVALSVELAGHIVVIEVLPGAHAGGHRTPVPGVWLIGAATWPGPGGQRRLRSRGRAGAARRGHRLAGARPGARLSGLRRAPGPGGRPPGAGCPPPPRARRRRSR
jgi:hypothetical protein